jgi:hypothetical protein
MHHIHELHQTASEVEGVCNMAAPASMAEHLGYGFAKRLPRHEILDEKQVLALLEERD